MLYIIVILMVLFGLSFYSLLGHFGSNNKIYYRVGLAIAITQGIFIMCNYIIKIFFGGNFYISWVAWPISIYLMLFIFCLICVRGVAIELKDTSDQVLISNGKQITVCNYVLLIYFLIGIFLVSTNILMLVNTNVIIFKWVIMLGMLLVLASSFINLIAIIALIIMWINIHKAKTHLIRKTPIKS